VMDDASVTGMYAVAFVASGSITIRGVLDASATQTTPGPGAQEPPAACVGESTMSHGCGILVDTDGAGGAGNATAGAHGGTYTTEVAFHPGGAATPTFVPLVGGCRGGDMKDTGGGLVGHGGGGGGA